MEILLTRHSVTYQFDGNINKALTYNDCKRFVEFTLHIFYYTFILHLIFYNSFQIQEENDNLFNWFYRKLSFWMHHHDQPILMKIKTFKYLIKYQITIGDHYTPSYTANIMIVYVLFMFNLRFDVYWRISGWATFISLCPWRNQIFTHICFRYRYNCIFPYMNIFIHFIKALELPRSATSFSSILCQ